MSKPHALTYAAAEAQNPQALYESRVAGGLTKHHLDRQGRPALWLTCDADEFVAALDSGNLRCVDEPQPEPVAQPRTEGERLLSALHRLDLSITDAAARIGIHRQTLTDQLRGRRALRRAVAAALWRVVEAT